MAEIKLRKAGGQDADVIARFVDLAAREDGGALPIFNADSFRRDALRAAPLIEVWVAEDVAVCGHVIAHTGYDLVRATPTMVVISLYVAPTHRRFGVARQLLSIVAARALDLAVRELTISTGVDNATARRFFESVGAREDRLSRYLLEFDEIEWLAKESG